MSRHEQGRQKGQKVWKKTLFLEKSLFWFTLPEVESITSGEDLPWQTHSHIFTRFFQPANRSLFMLFASETPPDVW